MVEEKHSVDFERSVGTPKRIPYICIFWIFHPIKSPVRALKRNDLNFATFEKLKKVDSRLDEEQQPVALKENDFETKKHQIYT